MYLITLQCSKEWLMGRKVKTSIGLDQDLRDWINDMVKRKRFANTTHAIEYALQLLKEQGKQNLQMTVFQEEENREISKQSIRKK
jgi:Arc/MetJ-type ribon-helix-helix transcriptional regulator